MIVDPLFFARSIAQTPITPRCDLPTLLKRSLSPRQRCSIGCRSNVGKTHRRPSSASASPLGLAGIIALVRCFTEIGFEASGM